MLLNLLINGISICLVFIVAFLFDYCFLWILIWTFSNAIGQSVLVPGILKFVQAFSLDGVVVLYFLTLIALVVFHLKNYNRVLWKTKDHDTKSLKSKIIMHLNDIREAFFDAVFLFLSAIVFLILVVVLLILIRLFAGSLGVFEVGAALALAAGYTAGFLLSIMRDVDDLFEKLFEFSLWLHVRDFLRRQFSKNPN